MTTARITYLPSGKERQPIILTQHPKWNSFQIKGTDVIFTLRHERRNDGSVIVEKPCCDSPPEVIETVQPGNRSIIENNGYTITIEHDGI